MPLKQNGRGKTNTSKQSRNSNIHFVFSILKNENIKHFNTNLFLNGRRPSAADNQLESDGWRETQTSVSLFCSLISHETHQSPSMYPK